MTTCEHAGIVGAADGFTLIELIVVLAVLGLLVGTGVPLAGAVVQADRRQEAQRELADIAAALDSYWFERAAFPATLATTGFLGTHLPPLAHRQRALLREHVAVRLAEHACDVSLLLLAQDRLCRTMTSGAMVSNRAPEHTILRPSLP